MVSMNAAFYQRENVKIKDLCHQQNILTKNKGLHDKENHCGYLISMVLVMSHFVKSI